jgi:hypothetical protein
MRTDPLSTAAETTYQLLTDRLRAAETDSARSGDPRIHYQHTDMFLATASRRVAAVDAVLVPVAGRELPHAAEVVHELVHRARALERTLATVKAKLYGEAHNVGQQWGELWRDVDQDLAAYLTLEGSLVHALASHLDEARLSELAHELHDRELNAPSRPHPYSPHTGLGGRLARSIWAKADRLWDAAEGRIVPEPVHPHHKQPGLVAQYVLADPRFDPDEPRSTSTEANERQRRPESHPRARR